MSDYDELTDEEIVEKAQQGDEEAANTLLTRYKNIVSYKTRPYFLIGADREDIIQEGMIGLYKALRDFDRTRFPSFRGYAEVRIQNQIIGAIQSANRQKNMPLNHYVSLNKPIYEEGGGWTLMDTLQEQRSTDPMELLIGQENLDSIESHLLPQLSPLERSVFYAYLDGKSYREIADSLGKGYKTIDNSLQRIKMKLVEVLRANQIFIQTSAKDAEREAAVQRRREAVRKDARERQRAAARARKWAQERRRRKEIGMKIRRKTARKRKEAEEAERNQLRRRRAFAETWGGWYQE